MQGFKFVTNTSAFPEGLNLTDLTPLFGNVEGLVNFVPKPLEADQGYTETNGLVECATAMASPVGLNATPLPVPVGSVAGFPYLVPKPLEADQGYTEIN